jgi:predicted SprT family Zn-dependent metalloprotease
MSLFDERRAMIEARVNELISLAEVKFGIKLPPVEIRFDLRGRIAGQAAMKYRSYRDNTPYFYVRFNVDMMINDSWDHLYGNTIPHELAHIVCFYRGSDSGHGKIWRHTCIQLGGSGSRCHNEKIVYSRGNTWHYVTTSGETVRLSDIRHRRVQAGQIYIYREAGRVDNTCWYSNEAPRT